MARTESRRKGPVRFRPARLVGVCWCALAGLGVAVSEAGDAAIDQADAPRFRIEAASPSKQTSSCGRFTLEANARYTPESTTADGRFSLKAVHAPAAGCNPDSGALFSDGFEAS